MAKKRRLIHIACFAFLASIANVGWSVDAAPNCSSEDVTSVVLGLAKDKLRDAVATQLTMLKDYKAVMLFARFTTPEGVIEDPNFISKLQEIDARVNTMVVKVTGVRTQSKDNDLKKVGCAAQLDVDGKVIPITYDAQYSDDGSQVFVSASGL